MYMCKSIYIYVCVCVCVYLYLNQKPQMTQIAFWAWFRYGDMWAYPELVTISWQGASTVYLFCDLRLSVIS